MRRMLFLGVLIVVGLFVDGCRENAVGPAPLQEHFMASPDTLSKKSFPNFAGDTLSSAGGLESAPPGTKKDSGSSLQKGSDR